FEPAGIAQGKAVAESPGNRDAEPCRRGGKAEVADCGEDQPAADSRAVNDGNARHRQVLEPGDDLLDPLLVGNPVLAAAEGSEFGDVGAGDEGAARAAKDRDAKPLGRIDPGAGLVELAVHLE